MLRKKEQWPKEVQTTKSVVEQIEKGGGNFRGWGGGVKKVFRGPNRGVEDRGPNLISGETKKNNTWSRKGPAKRRLEEKRNGNFKKGKGRVKPQGKVRVKKKKGAGRAN